MTQAHIMKLNKSGGAQGRTGHSTQAWPDGTVYSEAYLTDDGIGFEVFYDEKGKPDVFKAVHQDRYIYEEKNAICFSRDIEVEESNDWGLAVMDYMSLRTNPYDERPYGSCAYDLFVPAAIVLRQTHEKEKKINGLWMQWELQKTMTKAARREVVEQSMHKDFMIDNKFNMLGEMIPKTTWAQIEYMQNCA